MGTIRFTPDGAYNYSNNQGSFSDASTSDEGQDYTLRFDPNFGFFMVAGALVGNEANIATLATGLYADFSTNVGNVVLSGATVGNVLLGGVGDDAIRGGAGDDVLSGGAGFDRVSYSNAVSGVTVDLAITDGQNTRGAGLDTLSGFEWVTGSKFGDVLLGSDVGVQLDGMGGADTLRGGTGDDTFNGGGGYDRVTYLNAANGVEIDLRLPSQQTGAGSDTFNSIEALTGSNYNDSLTGSDTGNLLEGKAGDDYLDGGLGNDTLIGGKGGGSFAFTSTLGAGNVDTIKDFEVSRDQILLDAGVFQGILSSPDGHLYPFQYSTSESDEFGTATILYNQGTGELSFDQDGSGGTYGAVLFARVTPGLELTTNNFTAIGSGQF